MKEQIAILLIQFLAETRLKRTTGTVTRKPTFEDFCDWLSINSL